MSWYSQSKTLTTQPIKSFIHLLVWYLSYLLFPLFFMLLLVWSRGALSWWGAGIGLILTLWLGYARFIEPRTLVVKYTDYDLTDQKNTTPLKIALIADLHVGLFSGAKKQIQMIVERIQTEKPDIVVVAGDWTYEPTHHLADHLVAFQQLDMPVYSVNGNHDETYPGPPILALLKSALSEHNIIDIEQQVIEFDHFRLVGVGDLWAGKADMQFIAQLPQDKPYIIVSHNPDTVDMVPKLAYKALMLSGHTHGGQVEIPWFTNNMMKNKSRLGHKRGLYQHEHADVYVTVGTGMVGVPFRFRVPPTIDIICVS
ncbi:metallophosphoesterase family protein [Acinetobacter sp. EC24]|nr:metallophosphoesterase family protein [Acinetobacter rathckeae]MBF7696596.1 metallophosphoesterase family protein [Acinetobacter rathckeae]